jgi:hypothetical protein
VLIDELASNSVNLKLRFYSDSRRLHGLTVGSEVKRRLPEAFDAAGIVIPSALPVVQIQYPPSPAPTGDGEAPAAREDGHAAATPPSSRS